MKQRTRLTLHEFTQSHVENIRKIRAIKERRNACKLKKIETYENGTVGNML